ncbi:MAG: FtsH protease activity modulator HflK [bacterium]
MPWNKPGADGSDDNDSWDQHDRPRGERRGQRAAPPDLDEIFRDAKSRLDALLGGGRRGSGGGGNGRGGDGGARSFNLPGGMIGLVLAVVVGVWLFSGVYTVDQGEQAIEMRFGKYQETKDAGLHWHVPTPIESIVVINTQNVNTVEVGYRKGTSNLSSVPREALMLTQDENIIDIQFAVQYDIKDPTALLFNVSEFNNRNMAETVVRQATESAVREIVGRNTMDFAITEGRARLAAETKSLVQQILDRYETGINIRTVEMQNAQPPSQVKNAFDDVVRAREDEERIKNLAQAYANDIIPKARGFAARILQEAEAYKEATVARADGQAARFEQVLGEYIKAPQVTRDRIYLESMEQVLSNSSKMIIDQQGGNSVMYLPLDQLIRDRAGGSARAPGQSATSPSGAERSAGDSRNSDRNAIRTGRN